jgi:hypothetical protein
MLFVVHVEFLAVTVRHIQGFRVDVCITPQGNISRVGSLETTLLVIMK